MDRIRKSMLRHVPTTLAALALGALALGLAPAPVHADGPFQFHSVTPCRIVDTRNPANTTGGGSGTGGPALSNASARDFPIQGQCGVPVGAKAAVLNVTITQPTKDGHLTLWPSGTTKPLVSTLNFAAGEPAIANGAIVPLSANAQDLSVQPGLSAAGTVHVILDVTGYFE
jgi:hypothetical protein